MRVCGECRWCCWIFPVPGLDKPADQWCRFAGPGGCTIHEGPRPAVCREYACYWLDEEDLPETFRPDRIGMVVTETDTIAVAGRRLPVWVLHPCDPSAPLSEGATRLIEVLLALGGVLFLIRGLAMETLYDRTRYRAISEAQLEAAFRRRRSKDAESILQGGIADLNWRLSCESTPHAPREGPAFDGESE